jgi:hypothetical protein
MIYALNDKLKDIKYFHNFKVFIRILNNSSGQPMLTVFENIYKKWLSKAPYDKWFVNELLQSSQLKNYLGYITNELVTYLVRHRKKIRNFDSEYPKLIDRLGSARHSLDKNLIELAKKLESGNA